MFHHKTQGFLTGFHHIDATFVVAGVDAQLVAVSFKLINFLAEGVIHAYSTEVLTCQRHAFIGGVGEEGASGAVFIHAR